MIFALLAILAVILLGGGALMAKNTADTSGTKALAGATAPQYELDPALVYGVIMTESGGNPSAENPSDPSTGLMGVQALIGRAYAGLTGTDVEVLASLKDPSTNLAAGCGFLAHLQRRYGDIYNLRGWIQAYNLGETKFDNGVRNPPYADKVLDFMTEYQRA